MSTRSLIAMQIEENQYRTIYCHSDGYLTYNGAMLLDYYNTPEKVKELIDLGSISFLAKKLNPDPSKPHSFNFGERQEDVVVAYGRDRGEKDVEAKNKTLVELNDPNTWAEYIYIFTQDNKWSYFIPGHSYAIRDVETDLNSIYERYGVNRPEDYYGFVDEEIINCLKEENMVTPLEDNSGMEMN